jgi:hypothetical protein
MLLGNGFQRRTSSASGLTSLQAGDYLTPTLLLTNRRIRILTVDSQLSRLKSWLLYKDSARAVREYSLQFFHCCDHVTGATHGLAMGVLAEPFPSNGRLSGSDISPFWRRVIILSSHLRLGFLLASPPNSYMHSSSPTACYMAYPSHAPCLCHSKYIWQRVQAMKLLIRQFSRTSYHFIPLRSKYSPQHPVLKYFQSLNVRNQVSHSYKTKGKIIVLYILFFTFLDSIREDKMFWTER